MKDAWGATSRRALLAGVSGVAAGVAGCLGEVRRAVDRDSPSQLTVEIKTLPEDSDIFALRVANHLAENLEAAGIQADIEPLRHATFLRHILINLDFELYVWRLPGQIDPDFLRPLLHSRFAEEPGWQNPFSFSNRVIDDRLEEQLEAEERSRDTPLNELQREIIEEYPLVPIAFETDHRVYRTDRLRRPEDIRVDDPLWLLNLRPPDGEDPAEYGTVLGTPDWRLTHNLNPIAVEYRGREAVTELLYDSLARPIDGEYVPWLASSWRWTSPAGARAPTMEVILRSGLEWTDGEPITADDVAFTFQFLQDTSMTAEDPVIPAPRFRGRSTLLDSIEAVDERTVRIQFVPTNRQIARHLLSVPILPEHVWAERTEITEVVGIPVSDVTTDALVVDNIDPVGSGPYRVAEVETDSLLSLERFDEHFLFRDGEDTPALDVSPIAQIDIEIRPSVGNVANAVAEGSLDGSLRNVGNPLRNQTLEADEAVGGFTEETSRLFHVGFNVREPPFANHAFRGAVSRLIDVEFVIDEIFRGAAEPTLTPVRDPTRVPQDLVWDDAAYERFVGTPGTGEVDEDAARDVFRDAGFQYSEDGTLLSR